MLLLSPFALLGQLQNDQEGTIYSLHVSSIQKCFIKVGVYGQGETLCREIPEVLSKYCMKGIAYQKGRTFLLRNCCFGVLILPFPVLIFIDHFHFRKNENLGHEEQRENSNCKKVIKIAWLKMHNFRLLQPLFL